MSALRVVLFGDGYAQSTPRALLSRSGLFVISATEAEEFRELVHTAQCAVIIAIEVPETCLPDPLRSTHLPPVVLVSPLQSAEATRRLQHKHMIHELLLPEESPRLLGRTVIDAAICDVFDRVRLGVLNSHLLERRTHLRGALLQILEKPVVSVQSVARSNRGARRSLERQWRQVFPAESKPEAFVRGMLLLRAIRLHLRDPDRDWTQIAGTLGITSDRLRSIARDLASATPSDLEHVPLAAGIARVCEHSIPRSLLDLSESLAEPHEPRGDPAKHLPS